MISADDSQESVAFNLALSAIPSSTALVVSKFLESSHDPLSRIIRILVRSSNANQQYLANCAATCELAVNSKRRIADLEVGVDQSDSRVDELATDVAIAQETTDRSVSFAWDARSVNLMVFIQLFGLPDAYWA